jgi:hypothetical protein
MRQRQALRAGDDVAERVEAEFEHRAAAYPRPATAPAGRRDAARGVE